MKREKIKRKSVKEKAEQLLSILLTIVLVLTLVLVDGLITDTYAEETMQVEETYIPEADDLPDNDELFAGYVERTLYGESDIALLADYGENVLNDKEMIIYNELKTAIKKIAAGVESSTKITITSDSVIDSWTTNKTGEALKTEVKEKFEAAVNIRKIIDCLMVDCPYELYWYDKTTGYRTGYSYSTSVIGGVNNAHITDISCSFAVAGAYAGSETYTTNTAKTGAASAAVANAMQVINDNAGKSDYEKLKVYKEYICGQVSYNHEAVNNNYSYGDPWQLIYVFDGNNSTNVVCEGYSKAFQYLCDLSTFSSVVCYTVTGTMDGGTGAGAHMWNIVTLNGKNYIVDVTNSDEGTIGQDGGLFLTGTSGSVTSGYNFIIDEHNSVIFRYDTETTSLYNSDILTLSAESYTEQNVEQVEPVGTAPSCGAISNDTVWTQGTLESGTLIVEEGVTLTITGKVTIGGEVTIKGGGTILRGNENAYFFVGPGKKLTLEDITLEGNLVSSRYPMIYVSHGAVTLDDGCIIKNCIKNGSSGAALQVEYGTAVLNDVIIEKCSADNMGGAVFTKNGNVIINDGTYKENQTTSTLNPIFYPTLAWGGGFIYNISSELYIYGGKFIDNTSIGRGGCIYHTGIEGTKTYLYGGYFQGNKSSYPGYKGSGAVFNSSVSYDSTFFEISGNVQFVGDDTEGSGTDGVYLDMQNSTPRKIHIGSPINSPVSIYVNASEHYIIAEGSDGYRLQKKDMKQMTFFDGNNIWYAWLDEVNNQIYTSATPPPYGLFVYYASNGANGTVEDNTEYQSGATTTVKSADALSLENCEFIGWNTKPDGSGTYYNARETITMTGDITLYAIWSAGVASYKVEHYLQDVTGDGYTKAASDTEERTGVIGDEVTAIAKDYTGFTENTVCELRKASGIVDAGGTLELKLYYDRNTYEINFDLNGAEGNAPDTQTVRYGGYLQTVETPVRKGYNFKGWCKAEGTESVPWNFDKTVEKNITTQSVTLYAIWSAGESSYKVEHYLQDVIGDGYTIAASDTEVLTGLTGDTVTAEAKDYPGFTENTHYELRKETGTVDADGTLVLKLYYDRNTYEIGFDLNGAEGNTPDTQTVRYGGCLQTVEAPVKTGYTFKGWYKPEGTEGILWDFEKPVEENTTSGSVVLYAVWKDETAPVLGEVSFTPDYKKLNDWIIGKKDLTIIVPILEEGSGVKSVEYTLTPENGIPVTKHFDYAVRSRSRESVVEMEPNVVRIFIEENFIGMVSVVCTDYAGNVSEVKKIASSGGIIVEDSAPEIAFSSPDGDLSEEFLETANVKVTVKDDGNDSENSIISGGIASVVYQIDGGAENKLSDAKFGSSIVTSYDFTVDLSGKGEHILSVAVTDNAGNVSKQQITVKISEVQEEVQEEIQEPVYPEKNTNTPPDNHMSTEQKPNTEPTTIPERKEPVTGDFNHVEIYATVAMIAGLSEIFLYFCGNHGITEERKKELVLRILRWAKDGGKIRKLSAFIALFFVLLYYHSIGKQVNVRCREVYGK